MRARIIEIFTLIITFINVLMYKYQNSMGRLLTTLLVAMVIFGAIMNIKEAFFDAKKENK